MDFSRSGDCRALQPPIAHQPNRDDAVSLPRLVVDEVDRSRHDRGGSGPQHRCLSKERVCREREKEEGEEEGREEGHGCGFGENGKG